MLHKFTVTLLFVIVSLHSAFSDEGFQYFKNPDVDYWSKPSEKAEDHHTVNQVVQTQSESSFPWKKYLNPKSDEFFKEGDYIPPAPFMEIARNPTDDNIANWFHYLEMKNEITRRLQTKLAEYTAKKSLLVGESELPPVHPAAQPVTLDKDAKRFRLRLYFDSKCPHCHRMLGTMADLSRQGYWVELKQIDSDVKARASIPFAVTGATPSELKQYQIQSVPLLLVGDLKRQTFFKISGYQTTSSVLATLRSEPTEPHGGHS